MTAARPASPGSSARGRDRPQPSSGPEDGTRYLAITDNAVPAEHLIVIDTWATKATSKHRKSARHRRPRIVCDIPVLTLGPSGTENNPVGSGRSVFLASTYGYPYPAEPAGASPTDPPSAPFTGGVTRVDLNPGSSGCSVTWQDGVRSAAVPRLDVTNGVLYTVARTSPDLLSPDQTTDADTFSSVAIDATTGAVEHSTLIGAGYLDDTLQLAPTIVPGGFMYQGTISGIVRISPATGVALPVLP